MILQHQGVITFSLYYPGPLLTLKNLHGIHRFFRITQGRTRDLEIPEIPPETGGFTQVNTENSLEDWSLVSDLLLSEPSKQLGHLGKGGDKFCF